MVLYMGNMYLLDSVWLIPQNEEATIKIARIFRALKYAIKQIQKYYNSIIMKDQPRFPTFQSCYKGDIEYQEITCSRAFSNIIMVRKTLMWL